MKRTAPTPLRKHIKESPELQKLIQKRKRTRRILTVGVSVALVAVVVGLVCASRIRAIRIDTVTVSGNQVIDTEDVTHVVDEYLSGYYAYVVPRNNAFLYARTTIQEDIARTFPRFRFVDVSREGMTKLQITVAEERGSALWCGTTIDPIDPTAPCYFVNEHGMVIDTAPYYSGNVYIRFYGSTVLAAEDAPLGKSFVEDATYTKLTAFADGVKALGLPLRAVRIGGNENAFLLDVGSGTPAFVRFKANDDYTLLLSNLRAAMEKEELKTQLAKDLPYLQYFDLRFTNKVYYKFGGAEAVN